MTARGKTRNRPQHTHAVGGAVWGDELFGNQKVYPDRDVKICYNLSVSGEENDEAARRGAGEVNGVMRNIPLRRFVCMQASILLVTVLCCVILPGGVSYSRIREELRALDRATGDAYLRYCSTIMESRVVSAAGDMVSQILVNFNDGDRFRYYINGAPFATENIGRLAETADISRFCAGLRESNSLLREVGLFYVGNQLLVNSSAVIYDAYYEFRRAELSEYNELVARHCAPGASSAELLCSFPREDVLRLTRAVYSGTEIGALIVLDFSLPDIYRELEEYLWDAQVDFLMLDNRGVIMADTRSEGTGSRFEDLSYGTAEPGEHGYYETDVNGTPSVVSVMRSNGYSYVSIVPVSRRVKATEFLGPNIAISLIATLILGSILSLVLALWQGRSLSPILDALRHNDSAAERSMGVYTVIRDAVTKLVDTAQVQEHELGRIIPILQEKFVLWFFTSLPQDPDEIRDNVELMRVEYRFGQFSVLAVRNENEDELDGEYSRSELVQELERALNTEDSAASFCWKDGVLWGIVNYGIPYGDLLRRMEDMRQGHGCMGRPHDRLEELSGDAADIEEGLGYGFLYPNCRCMPVCDAQRIEKRSYDDRLSRQIYRMIRRRDAQKAVLLLNEMEAQMRTECSVREARRILLGLAEELEKCAEPRVELRQSLEQAPQTLEAWCGRLREGMERYLTGENLPGSTAQLARQARSYMDAHLLDSQLSLQKVADELGINATYLSTIFAQMYDRTFIEYLTVRRMEYAQRLLTETDMTLEEIAGTLNYSSSKYFIGRFKLHCGTTPSVYRRESRRKP